MLILCCGSLYPIASSVTVDEYRSIFLLCDISARPNHSFFFHMLLQIVAAVVLLGAKTSYGAGSYDCKAGCSLSQGPPVIGDDGQSYFNECLAYCQVRTFCQLNCFVWPSLSPQ